MDKKIVFWGAGKIGKKVLMLWGKLDICPDFFCDNSRDLWGREVEGVRLLSPQEVFEQRSRVTVFVTCGRYAEIKRQLMDNGIAEADIVRADDTRAPEMLYKLSDIFFHQVSYNADAIEDGYKCLIDLSGGMVLGGVERWSFSLAEIFNKLQIKSAYLMPGDCDKRIENNTIPAVFVENRKGIPIIDTIEEILYRGTDIVICNFPFEIMIGACVIKKSINPNLKIIAVLHNDEDIYYRTLKTWEKYIDVCLTISTRIKSSLLQKGFPPFKIKDLFWKIPCNKNTRSSYSAEGSPLRIGYAGRISVRQKRADLLLEVGEKLRENKVEFLMDIVGTGDYEEELKEQIQERSLGDSINFYGKIPHDQIAGFWEKQDVCISCSEWEGHSISHSEAMASGAVLVITNTSGAEDNVDDGINGFLVEIGDMEALAKHIIHLNKHRELLHKMGNRSIEKIIARNKYMEAESYWKLLLE